MIVKLIKAVVKPGLKEEFLEQQRAWNDAISRQAGFMGIHVATDSANPDLVYILAFMESQEALERFMSTDHDLVEEKTAMKDLYSDLVTQVLDVVDPYAAEVRFDIPMSRAGSGYQIAALSEIYRLSCALRVAVVAGLFDSIGEPGASITELANRHGANEIYVRRLVEALAAVNLLAIEEGRIYLKPLASRHLVRGREAYLGDLILHNTRSLLWRRWGSLDEELGLVPEAAPNGEAGQFLRAMSNVAASGQAAALVSAVDLGGRRRLLDVGGGLGEYSIALCRLYPQLTAIVLDLPGTAEPLRTNLVESGQSDRVSLVAGDYRSELPNGEFDVVLVSNVLRGETTLDAKSLVDRVYQSMVPGGLLVIQDLFIDDRQGVGPLFAALFGLHLPDSMNGSVQQVTALLRAAGFRVTDTVALDGHVVANKVITAEKT